MAATINTNIASINAQRNLALSGQSLNTTMQRLSSGLRVNSAKDDAAGLAIAERMNTQVKGLTVAARNANDGISLAQTAEGALGKVGDMLQRMRELAVQASNATNSDSDRAALQAEVSQLAAEIDRVAKQTNFNGQKILDGSFAGAVFQVGANSGDNVTLGALANTRSSQLSNITYSEHSVTFDTTDTPDLRAIRNFDQVIEEGDLSIKVGAGDDQYEIPLNKIEAANSSLERLGQVVTAINNKTADTGVTAYLTRKEGTNEYTVTLMSSKLDAEQKPLDIQFVGFDATLTGIGGDVTKQTPPQAYITDLQTLAAAADFSSEKYEAVLDKVFANNPALMDNDALKTALGNYNSSKSVTTAGLLNTAITNALSTFFTADSATSIPALKAKFEAAIASETETTANKAAAADAYRVALNTYYAATGATTPAGATTITGSMGVTDYETAIQTLQDFSAEASAKFPSDLNLNYDMQKPDQRGINDIDVTTQAGAWIALKKIDSAIDQINGARATLGAMQTRFETAVNNIDIQVENLSAARGRIVDADFAVETANLSRTQILQQAGTAMVAQANQIPQNVLQLLQG
ncbi:flagellin [Comamonas kerstersii]|uniref:flagellin N-terminal helical domain-containing protein n=1 Tax=Comamonas kerstersii TaxID=225992 RepID=UPI00259211C7|nr:flagellin [Comamonas kerstersii]